MTPSRPPQLIAAVRLTRVVSLQWLVVSVVGFLISAYAFEMVVAVADERALGPVTIGRLSGIEPAGWLAVCGLVVAIVVVHESIHGICLARYGGRPNYGVGLSYLLLPYAYAETQTTYTRTQMLVVVLSPVFLITALGVVLLFVYPSSVLAVALALNAAGSIGDLWMAGVVAQYPPTVRIGPLPDSAKASGGFGVYATTDVDSRRPGTAAVGAFCTGAVGTLTLTVVGIVATVFHSLAFDTGTVVVGNPDSWQFLFRHERVADGAILELGIPFVAALTALGGIGWLLITVGRNRLE